MGLPIVIDPSSQTLRAGFVGDLEPRFLIPSVVGRPKQQGSMEGQGSKADPQIFVGRDAVGKRELLSVKYPVEFGIIFNWNDMEILLNHTFSKELCVDPTEHPTVIVDPMANPSANREKMTQLMFETFNVPMCYMVSAGVAPMYAVGKTSGVVVEIRGGTIHIACVYDGFMLKYSVCHLPFGGSYLDDHLADMLNKEQSRNFISREGIEFLRSVKEQSCFVSQDYDRDMRKASESAVFEEKYQTSDKTLLTMNSERFRCPEALFQPSLMGVEMPGIAEIVLSSIKRVDKDVHNLMFGNILLTGGSTLLPGLPERLQAEIRKLAPTETVTVNSPSSRRHLPWSGAAVLASMPMMKEMWMTKDDYDEYGPSHMKKIMF